MNNALLDVDFLHLFNRFRRGSIEARNSIIVAVLPMLRHLASKVLVKYNATLADDMVQDAATYLMGVLQKFETTGKFRASLTTWIYKVARYRMLRYLSSLRTTKNGVAVIFRDFTGLSLKEKVTNVKDNVEFISLAVAPPLALVEQEELLGESRELLQQTLPHLSVRHRKIIRKMRRGKSLRNIPELKELSNSERSYHKSMALQSLRNVAKRECKDRFHSLVEDWRAC